MDTKRLIDEANNLALLPYDLPKIKLWISSVNKLILTNFGTEKAKVFDDITRISDVSEDKNVNQSMHEKRMY